MPKKFQGINYKLNSLKKIKKKLTKNNFYSILFPKEKIKFIYYDKFTGKITQQSTKMCTKKFQIKRKKKKGKNK